MADSKEIHFIGIGGIGVSALAGILNSRNKLISGSDAEESPLTNDLQKQGIKIHIGHKKENISDSADLVIHSLAVPRSNPEMRCAAKLGIPILSYPEAVGELTRDFFTICISGTHGKSTVTAMIAKVLIENNFDPTVIVGTKLRELENRNYRVGKKSILILESCEYMRAFLNYNPKIALIHTLDPDHMDYYRNFNDYLGAFHEFAGRIPQDGYFFGNTDDEDVHPILQRLQSQKFPSYNTFTYGSRFHNADFVLEDRQISYKNEKIGSLDLKIPGSHNRTNALAAFAVCHQFGIPAENILKSLNKYKGASRRFEIKGKFGKIIVIDDYAHHPEEIKATLSAARENFPKSKICVVFQPHQYSRTKKLFAEFVSSLSDADCVIIPNIYSARDGEKDKTSVTPQKLVSAIKKNNSKIFVEYGDGLENTVKLLKKNGRKFDILFTMGAGDVWKIADSLLNGSSLANTR